MSRLAFVDCETVTLEPGHDVLWEVGIITRDPGQSDQEWLFQVRPNMGKADPKSLETCRFEERYVLTGNAQAAVLTPPGTGSLTRLSLDQLALHLRTLLTGAHVWGSTVSFDTVRLGLFLRRRWGKAPGYTDPWHYKPHEVKDLVAGYLWGYAGLEAPEWLATLPWSSDALAEAVGVKSRAEEKHTALGDARWARDLYDVVTGGKASE